MKTKRWLALTGLAVSTLPVAAVVSCSKAGDASNMLSKVDYDFGLATEAVNNLNYLRNNLGTIQDTVVFPLVESGPKGTLKNILQLPDFKFSQVQQNAQAELEPTGVSYSISQNQEYAGAISQTDNSYCFETLGSDTNSGLASVYMRLNEKNMWKGGNNAKYNRSVTANDYIDGMKYMLDLNNGSQLIARLLNTYIIGVEDVYNAQVEYVEAMGKTYSDPWGYNIDSKGLNFENKYTHLKSENPGDEKYVARIEIAARKLLSRGIVLNNQPISGRQPDEYDLRVNFDPNHAVGVMEFDSYYNKYLLPANREFIEDIGGIYKFGTTIENFMYTSPFNIDSIRLGQGGYINLVKDTSFFSAKYTQARKIKIYFQEDPNIISSMFKDGYISGAAVAATYLEKFWADSDLRGFMSKSQGFGTVAIRFNLSKDAQTSAANPTLLDDPDLRLAIAYGIERNSYIKLAGWDSAAITTMWNVKGIGYTTDGRAIDTFFDNQYYKDIATAEKPEAKQIPITSMSYNERTAIIYRFEHAFREDARHNTELANQHLAAYLAKHNSSSVSLTFLCTGEQGVKQGLGLKSQFADIFGSKIKLEVRSVPKSSYDNMITHGQFDMSVDNFDKFGMTPDSYYKALIWPDEIDKSINRTSGYLNNPSGSWTFSRFYDRIEKSGEVSKYQKALGIMDNKGVISSDNQKLWDKFVDLANHSKTFTRDNQDYVNSLFGGDGLQDVSLESDEASKMYVLFEKIIALDAPIVPLYEVDTKWSISRLVGINNLYQYDLQFAYDALKRPGDNLPGVELK